MKASIVWPVVLGGALLSAGCRQDLVEIVHLTGDTQTVSIERLLLPDKGLVDGLTSDFLATLGACAQAPTAWGAPSVVVFGSVGGEQLTGVVTPTVDASSANSAQSVLPRADYTWHCYQIPEDAYNGPDSGGFSWTFDATTEAAQVITTIGSAGRFGLMAVHDVFAGTTVPAGSWEAQTVVTSGATLSTPVSTSRPVYPGGTIGNRVAFSRDFANRELLLVSADGAVTAVQLPFDLQPFGDGQLLAASPSRAVAFSLRSGTNFIETPYTSADGETWTAAAENFPVADSVMVELGYSAGASRFFLTVADDSRMFYSTDGTDWSSSVEIGGDVINLQADTAVLPNGDLLVVARDGDLNAGLFLVNASTGGTQVITRPAEAILDWSVPAVTVAGDRAFALTFDSNAAETTLLTSTDGSTWTEAGSISGAAFGEMDAINLGTAFLVAFNNTYFVSTDNGASFSELDLASALPTLSGIASRPARVVSDGTRAFMALSLTNSKSVEGAILVSTEDLQSFQLNASLAESDYTPEYSLFLGNAGGTVIQFGEGTGGFRHYRYVAAGAGAGAGGGSPSEQAQLDALLSGSGSGGGAIPLLFLLFGLRRLRG